MKRKYFLLIDDAQVGPFPREQLRSRGMKRSTLVWYEGAADWLPAGKVAELASLFQSTAYTAAPAIRPKVIPPAGGSYFNPYTPGQILGLHKFARLLWWIGVGLLGALLVCILIALAVDASRSQFTFNAARLDVDFTYNRSGFGELFALLALLLGVLAVLVHIGAIILYFMLHYRCWTVLQDGYAPTTPGKAIGFLFLPFFNLFWLFVTFGTLSKSVNLFLARHRLAIPPVPNSAGFAVALNKVVGVVPFLGWPYLLANYLYFPRLYGWVAPAIAKICEDDNVNQVAAGQGIELSPQESAEVTRTPGSSLASHLVAPWGIAMVLGGIVGGWLLWLERGRYADFADAYRNAIQQVSNRPRTPVLQQRINQWTSSASFMEGQQSTHLVYVILMVVLVFLGVGLCGLARNLARRGNSPNEAVD